MMIDDEILNRLSEIFLPFGTERRKNMVERDGRFVHYTSAENGLKIVRSAQLWMRNTVTMVDYSEVQHGHDLLLKFFSSQPHRDRFLAATDACSNGVGQEGLNSFDKLWENIRTDTYIGSISEHANEEDLHGRLSMWRAFGRATAGVAFVFRLPLANDKATLPLNLILSPVAYFRYEDIEAQLLNVISNIEKSCEFLKSLPRAALVDMIYATLMGATVSLKHEGFAEEREWRVVYSPTRTSSPLMERSVEVIGGVPQIIYKIPLKENPEAGVSGIGLDTMLDRVIIGPSAYPLPIYEAFVDELIRAGVKDPGSRIVISGIPLRSA